MFQNRVYLLRSGESCLNARITAVQGTPAISVSPTAFTRSVGKTLLLPF